MRSRLFRALLVCAAIGGLLIHKADSAGAVSSGVVISQVYGGGGNSGATYQNDFVELFNRGASAVDITGWTVQYATSAQSAAWTPIATLSGTLQPGQYYLVGEAGGSTGAALPLADASGTTNLNQTNAKVALVSSATALAGSATGCPSSGSIVDLVGYGTNSIVCAEGSAAAQLSSSKSATRAGGGCTETDNNGSDFSALTPVAHNKSSTFNVCGGSSNNPQVTGNANPSSVDPGTTSLLTATVTPGASSIASVTVNLTAIGGGATQPLFDDGSHGDVTPGNNVYSFLATVPPGNATGTQTLPITVTDSASNTGTANISLVVFAPTPPGGSGSANPSSVTAGQSTQLTVAAIPGVHPASTVLTVTGDLSSIGGSASQAFTDNGNNTFTFFATVDASTPGGAKSLPVTIQDAQGRIANRTIALSVTSPGPSVVSTAPVNGATGVLVGSPITVMFNEPVTASGTAFAVQCPIGAFQNFTQSASPSATITLTPTAPLPGNTTCSVTITGSQITDTLTPSTAMTSNAQFSFVTAPAAAGQILINEIDADTPGSPQDLAEFIELKGPANTPLDGLVVVLYDGGLSTTSPAFSGNQSYAAFDLSGYSTDANGYFVLGNPGVPGVQLPFDPGDFGLLQNGPDAVALYIGHASNFPTGTIVTTTNLLDAIVYGTDDPAPANLMPLVTSPLIVNEDANGNGPNESSQRCPNGMGAVRTSTAYLQAAPTPGAPNACPSQGAPSSIVISQVYGGGGNNGTSTYHNDYVELYNRGTAPVDIARWSLQYASATGSGWSGNLQPLGGVINPGEYYLIGLGSNGANGAALPLANVTSSINIAVSSGKLALADTLDPVVGNCPLVNPHVRDFVGYGTSDCGEGASLAPPPNAAAADFRQGGGSVDTNNNQNDFVNGAPLPRRTAAIVPIPPYVFFTDPLPNATSIPRDATIEVSFTVPVDLTDPWFDISCASTGHHNDATVAGTTTARYITPNVNFQAGELCTATILQSGVQQTGVPGETLPGNYTWSFTVASGTAPPESPDVHLLMGNPTGATADLGQPTNYLMSKPEYALSYNSVLGRANWVSWHVTQAWIPTNHPARVDTFRADPQVPPDWYRVESFDFSGSGFDRGHMSPNADRESSVPVNQATFLMSNMIAQAPANNQGPWADFEGYLRTVANGDDPSHPNEVYIVSGPAGKGGAGSNGAADTLAGGKVTVPASTWKVALVLPDDGAEDDASRVTCSTRTIAVILPNDQTTQGQAWQTYLTTVTAVEQLVRTDTIGGFTQFSLFSNLPAPIQFCIKHGINGTNPKNDQTITFAPLAPRAFGDADFAITAAATSGLPVTFAVTSGSATVSGNIVHITGLGSVTITASQPGDDTYNPAANVVHSFDVGKGSQTIVFDAVPGHTYGDGPFAVSATGGASGAAVTFAASGACTSGGSNGTTITIAAAGACAITASQAGSADFDAAADVTRTVTIASATPALSGLSSPAIEAGTASTTISGTIGVNGLVPAGSVTITVGGSTRSVPIALNGQFSATVTTASLSPANSPYPIAFAFAANANFGSAAGTSTLTVTDTIAPVITLVGAATVTVEGGTAFTDPGATATDSFAGNLTGAIQVTGAVNTAVVGSYTRTYTVGDGYNTASTTRTVNVVDTIAPVITLVGGATVTTALGQPWVDPGATAQDSRAGNLTPQIVVTGAVNTAVAGSYPVTYRVSDGVNTTTAIRTVTVSDTTAPLITHLSATPNTLYFPTNTLWPVFVTYDASDASGEPSCSLAVTSNDLDDRENTQRGHGVLDLDWIVVSPHLVFLRAERGPRKAPQLLYTVTVTCTDRFANRSTAQVVVPVRQR